MVYERESQIAINYSRLERRLKGVYKDVPKMKGGIFSGYYCTCVCVFCAWSHIPYAHTCAHTLSLISQNGVLCVY